MHVACTVSGHPSRLDDEAHGRCLHSEGLGHSGAIKRLDKHDLLSSSAKSDVDGDLVPILVAL